MQTYLVTGGAGFIGTNLCKSLLDRGHSVIAVDNFCTGNRHNLNLFKGSTHFEFIEHDVIKPLTVNKPIDGVFHLASPASPVDFERLSLEILKVNSVGTENMLELARTHKAWLLFSSTSEVYGDAKEHPQSEEYWGNVNPNGPRSCYDESKRFAESLIVNYANRHQIRTAIVRIFNTYGPYMRKNDGRVISNFINQALKNEPITVYGHGQHTRCLCYVEDMVEGLIKASQTLDPKPINIGSDHEISILALAEKVLQVTGSKSQIVYKSLPVDDPKIRRPNLRRAHTLLQWQAKHPLEEGIKLTMNYFKNLSSEKP